MKLSIDRQEFEKCLFIGQNVAQPKGAMQILSYLLLSAEDNQLIIKATDLEISIRVECEAEVQEAGQIILPARTLYDTVRKGINSTLTLATTGEFSCTLDTGTNYKLVGLDPKEFPDLPAATTNNFLSLSAGRFIEAIKSTLYSTSDNEARLALNGVYLEPREEGLRFVATDGHRLAMTTVQDTEGKLLVEKSGVILSRKSLQELIKSLPDKKETIQLSLYDRFVVFRWKSVECTLRLVDSEFPDYTQVIPDNLPSVVSFDRTMLLDSIDRVGAVANDRFSGLKFTFLPGEVELSCNNYEHGESRDKLAIEYNGEESRIGFNIRYIQAALQAMDTDEITMHFSDQLSAALFMSQTGQTLAVVMPLRI